MYGSQWEALQKTIFFYYKSRENLYQYCKSCENLYQVQVTCAVSKHAMKSEVCIIKHYLHSTRLLPLALLLVLRTCNNTDGNKLVIFSSIALYYGGTYIVSAQTVFPCERLRSGHKANATSPFTNS